MTALAKVLGTARPNFLLLPPVCVMLGAAAANLTVHQLPLDRLALILVGALLAHAAVNLFNEHEDFKSGLDATTARTPFSGGSGVLPGNPEVAGLTRLTAIECLVATIVIGMYLVVGLGWGLLPLGFLGVLIIVFYTSVLTRHWLACLVAPGLGFGPLMVMGTSYALTGHYAFVPALVSLTPFFLISNLLLLNQFPDAEPDREVGRRHLLVVGGPHISARVFVVFLVLAFAPIVLGLTQAWLPRWAALGLVPMPLAAYLGAGVLRRAGSVDGLLPLMGLNVLLCLLTPTLLAIGLFLGGLK